MSQKPPPKQFVKTPINGTKFVLLVSSAKGGVGKSTVAVNLAFALQNLGLKIGILDADVYGPSLPKLINLNEKPKSEDGKAMVPLEKYGAQCMSMGFLVDEQTPMIWRGPMVISAIKTMTQKVLWRDRDVIIIDMPPGTGDTQLTFAQEVKVDGAIIVSTPQDLALLDVKRGIQMFDKTGVKILGLIDNMSFFKGDDGKNYNASPYAWSKSSNTALVKNYASWFDINYAITYFYNVYGPGEISEGKYSTVIAKFLKIDQN